MSACPRCPTCFVLSCLLFIHVHTSASRPATSTLDTTDWEYPWRFQSKTQTLSEKAQHSALHVTKVAPDRLWAPAANKCLPCRSTSVHNCEAGPGLPKWLEHLPEDWRVAGSIPGSSWGTCVRQPVSISLSRSPPPPFHSLSKGQRKNIFQWGLKGKSVRQSKVG